MLLLVLCLLLSELVEPVMGVAGLDFGVFDGIEPLGLNSGRFGGVLLLLLLLLPVVCQLELAVGSHRHQWTHATWCILNGRCTPASDGWWNRRPLGFARH